MICSYSRRPCRKPLEDTNRGSENFLLSNSAPFGKETVAHHQTQRSASSPAAHVRFPLTQNSGDADEYRSQRDDHPRYDNYLKLREEVSIKV